MTNIAPDSARSKQDEEKIYPYGKIMTAGHVSVKYRSGEDIMKAQVVTVTYDEDNSQPRIVPAGVTGRKPLQILRRKDC